jgi:hypothetical protein
MNARNELNFYITQLERRLRLNSLMRGAAILIATALVTTIVLVWAANRFAFSRLSMTGSRVVLFAALACVLVFGIVLPILQLTRKRAATQAESSFSLFQQRLITFAERDAKVQEPFLELLAADTLDVARGAQPRILVPDWKLFAYMGSALASFITLLWMILAGPGYMGYGSRLMWTGSTAGRAPYYGIRVTPGDASVRRHADELITAQPIGVEANKVKLYARYQSSSKWEQVTMQPQTGRSSYQFLFAGLPERVEYYVQAGKVFSPHFHLQVVDLPEVKQIRVTYHFPHWARLQNVVEEHGGDLRAIEGTQAVLEVVTDSPLQNGVLVLSNGKQIPLNGTAANRSSGVISIDKDGAYHVAALDHGQAVRLSEDFFIEADKVSPPQIQVARPTPDYRASPIEEVAVAVNAQDPFGIDDLTLHYSVNGGPDKTVNLLKQRGQKEANGSTILSLENFKMTPGDVVSYYVSAKDARTESRSDMSFIQAEPFEREFSQSQQMAGGGGGGAGGQGGPSDISQREKEIISATWKQKGDPPASSAHTAETAKFLSEVQSKLRDQALALGGRLQMRDLNEQNEEFSDFQRDMGAAAEAMDPAADKLHHQNWNEALPDEQKALQHLLKAEATFRKIEVAFGNAGGGGGASGAGRDLASLFDLELDTQKNQYETAQTASSQDQQNREIDDALKKLDDLARRQQDLAQQSPATNGRGFEQRWQQEMLRRQAEELQQQIEQQLSQNHQQSSSQSQSGSSAGASSASSGQGSQQQSAASARQRVQQALDQLRQAGDDMRRAASGQQSSADARRAAERLQDATSLLGGIQQQQASGRLDSMAQQANKITAEQRHESDRLRQLEQGLTDSSEQAQQNTWNRAQTLAEDRQKLANDLGHLEGEMRDTERQLSTTQRGAASRLRDTLGGLDRDEIETKAQRSADRLRKGFVPNSDASEQELTKGLEQMAQGIRSAQQALGPESQQDSQTALDRVERLRGQMETLTRDLGARQTGQIGRSGQQSRGSNGLARKGAVQDGSPGGRQNAFANGNRSSGLTIDGQRGDGIQPGPWIDTGNNSNLPQPVAPDTLSTPSDSERVFEQSVSNLNQLRQTVRNDPEAARELRNLIDEMQRLDPKRFPGNPALLQQLHNQVMSDVNTLELQLRRKQDDRSGDIRSGNATSIPPGYEDAVAEYYRRLSKNQ